MTDKAVLSMTGFGRYHHRDDDAEYLVEVRTVNHRYLKLNVNLPEALSRFEDRLTRTVRSRLRRGAVDVRVRYRSFARPRVELNQLLVEEVARAWREAAGKAGLPDEVGAEALFRVPGVFEVSDPIEGLPDEAWIPLEGCLVAALDVMVAMRVEEGGALASSLAERCAEIRSRLDRIEELAPRVVAAYQERLKRNVTTLMAGGEEPLGLEELKREIAVFADRSDIHEEVHRAGKHLEEFSKLLARGGEAGRKMEFLAQELLREVNTLSAKANDSDISRLAVEAKTEIEKIKELAQNVE